MELSGNFKGFHLNDSSSDGQSLVAFFHHIFTHPPKDLAEAASLWATEGFSLAVSIFEAVFLCSPLPDITFGDTILFCCSAIV